MTKNTPQPPDYDDLGEAIREKRPLRKADHYRILFAQDSLNFTPLFLSDPVPLGRQLLEAAGCDAVGEFSLFAILPNGEFEDVRLDEAFDLRGLGAERFVAFQTDREFKLTLTGKEIQWGKPLISGGILYALADPSDEEAVFLEVPGGTDKLIKPEDIIDLSERGIEHFIVAPKPVPAYEITVNSRPKIVTHERVTFEEVVAFAFPGSHDPNIRFSMTYRHAKSQPHSGDLGPSGSVLVKHKGTIFNVSKTVQS